MHVLEMGKTGVCVGVLPHDTGSFIVHGNITVAFYNPPNVLLPELKETGSRSGCCRVVLCCSVIAPSSLGRGYFWLPPCLNPVVILQWIIHASSPLPSSPPPSSTLTPPPLLLTFSVFLSAPSFYTSPSSAPEHLSLTPPPVSHYVDMYHHYHAFS